MTITTFANQLATAIHITELRRPLIETVDRLTAQLGDAGADGGGAARGGGAAWRDRRARSCEGVVAEQAEVAGGLAATESLAQVSRRVSVDGTQAARASTTASDVASRNRQQIREAMDRLVALKTFVGESSAKVQALGDVSRRITGFISSIREFSDMTNLLSLNAAIEAARAGKHGKGSPWSRTRSGASPSRARPRRRKRASWCSDIHRRVGEVVEQMRRGQVNVSGVEELSSAALRGARRDRHLHGGCHHARAPHRGRGGRAGSARSAGCASASTRSAAIAGKNRAEADDVATRATEAARGLTDLERATRELESVAAHAAGFDARLCEHRIAGLPFRCGEGRAGVRGAGIERRRSGGAPGACPGPSRGVAAHSTERVVHRGRNRAARPHPAGRLLQSDGAARNRTHPRRALLKHLHAIERSGVACARVRWGPRTLDLDIVRFGDRQIQEPDLIIPHPELPTPAISGNARLRSSTRRCRSHD